MLLRLNSSEPLRTHQGKPAPQQEKFTLHLCARWISVSFPVLHKLFAPAPGSPSIFVWLEIHIICIEKQTLAVGGINYILGFCLFLQVRVSLYVVCTTAPGGINYICGTDLMRCC